MLARADAPPPLLNRTATAVVEVCSSSRIGFAGSPVGSTSVVGARSVRSSHARPTLHAAVEIPRPRFAEVFDRRFYVIINLGSDVGVGASVYEVAMKHEIKVGDQAYVKDGGEEFGAVRQVMANGDIVVYVENSGDFVVSHGAIDAVHSGKVIVHPSKLDGRLREAIGHSHDAEEPGL